VRVDSRGPTVLRVLPRINDDVNEEWISDKSRFACDGLKVQRLDHPYVRENGKLRPASWDEALDVVAVKLKEAKPGRAGAIVGDLAGAEEMFALKDLLSRLDIRSVDCRQDGAKFTPTQGRSSYLFNSTIAGIDEADVILLVGTNPRVEAAVLNGRIHKRYREGGLKVGLLGEQVALTYPYEYLGSDPEKLADMAEGRGAFIDLLKDAEKPMVIVGSGAAARADGAAILGLAARVALAAMEGKAEGWNAFNVLHTAASRVAGLDLGLVPEGKNDLDVAGLLSAAAKDKLDVLFLLGADEIDLPEAGSTFVIYQGSHGDRSAHRADVILPGAAYTEKSATYVNTEGRAQMTERAVFPPGQAKEDWAILRALSARAGQTLPYDTLTALRAAMYAQAPQLARIGTLAAADLAGVQALSKKGSPLTKASFSTPIQDFYLTNPIARASAVMAEMSALKSSMGADARLDAAE
jgi:NADH-quinone oxidoreductase subunit G